MKIYLLVEGYPEENNYEDYAKTAYATKELAAWAFEHRLKDAFEEDDVDGDSFDACVEKLDYFDGEFEMFVEEYDVIETAEEAAREEESLNVDE